MVSPDLPGYVAMGHTVDEAIEHAEEALRDYVSKMESNGWETTAPESLGALAGNQLVSVRLAKRSSPWLRSPLAQRAGRA